MPPYSHAISACHGLIIMMKKTTPDAEHSLISIHMTHASFQIESLDDQVNVALGSPE